MAPKRASGRHLAGSRSRANGYAGKSGWRSGTKEDGRPTSTQSLIPSQSLAGNRAPKPENLDLKPENPNPEFRCALARKGRPTRASAPVTTLALGCCVLARRGRPMRASAPQPGP